MPSHIGAAGLPGLVPHEPHVLELSDAQRPRRLLPGGFSSSWCSHGSSKDTGESAGGPLPEQLKGEMFSPTVYWEEHRSSAAANTSPRSVTKVCTQRHGGACSVVASVPPRGQKPLDVGPTTTRDSPASRASLPKRRGAQIIQ